MAFNDTLFQLGMDLTRSSPAQEEDIVAGSARVESGDRNTFFVERDGVRFASHLIVDLIGAKRLDDLKLIEGTLKRCVASTGGDLVGLQVSRATGRASLDIFVSGEADSYACVEALRAALSAREVVLKAHKRDTVLPQHVWESAVRKAAATRISHAPRIKKAA